MTANLLHAKWAKCKLMKSTPSPSAFRRDGGFLKLIREIDMFRWLITLLLVMTLSGCGYNTLQSTDENITASWAEVLNQYQRRADLVPNLVNVVKGYAGSRKGCVDPGYRGACQSRSDTGYTRNWLMTKRHSINLLPRRGR